DSAGNCGPLFGGIHKFRYQVCPFLDAGVFWSDVDGLWLAAGETGGTGCLFEQPSFISKLLGQIGPQSVGFPDLARSSGLVNWDFCMRWQSEVGVKIRDLRGVVLTGQSLIQETYSGPLGLAIFDTGPRRKPADFLGVFNFDNGLAWPITGDIAFLGLGMLY